jgi:hypothetical protein
MSLRRVIMDLATIRDAGQREARAELDQLTVTGGPDTLAETAREPVPPQRFREFGIAPARLLGRLLKAAGRRLRPRERRTPPAGFRMPFTLPEMPSLAEMTIIETPFRIPRYMDHPEWRPR